MTNPTRYFTYESPQNVVNGLTAFGLLTANSSSVDYSDLSSYSSIGVRVWKRTSGGVETEITAGTPVAQVSVPSSSGSKSNTWACPGSTLNTTDSIVVRVYGYASPSWTELTDTDLSVKDDFTTEQLGATQLDSVTWTVVYYFQIHTTAPIYHRFNWGNSTYPSQIQNLSYSSPVTAYIPSSMGDGLSWVIE